jgi:hypothetical protein
MSRIAAPALGLLAVIVAVGFVLAAPRLLDKPPAQEAIPAPPAGRGQVSSVVAPALAPPKTPTAPSGSTLAATLPATGSSVSATPSAPSTSGTDNLGPAGSPHGGGISATAGVRVAARPGHDEHQAKEHQGHHGHGEGHEHHGNGQGVGHGGDGTGDGDSDSDKGKDHSDKGNHNGWTKPKKHSPPKAHDSLGSGHGHGGKKSDRGDGAPAHHGKSRRRHRSHARARR